MPEPAPGAEPQTRARVGVWHAQAREAGPSAAGGRGADAEARPMNNIIYVVGLIVVILVVLSFLGLR